MNITHFSVLKAFYLRDIAGKLLHSCQTGVGGKGSGSGGAGCNHEWAFGFIRDSGEAGEVSGCGLSSSHSCEGPMRPQSFKKEEECPAVCRRTSGARADTHKRTHRSHFYHGCECVTCFQFTRWLCVCMWLVIHWCVPYRWCLWMCAESMSAILYVGRKWNGQSCSSVHILFQHCLYTFILAAYSLSLMFWKENFIFALLMSPCTGCKPS